MWHFILAIVALPPLFVLYSFAQSYYADFRWKRKSKDMSCGIPPVRPYKIPGNIDTMREAWRQDKALRIPSWFEDTIFKKMKGVGTFRNYFFGELSFMTVEPENLQAILAKQFNDFELGPLRRLNFWPMLGNGIFTADGADWSHGRALLRPQFARSQVGDLDMQERHVQDLFKAIGSTRDGWTSTVNLGPLFFRLTLDSATEFLFGESVHSQISALPGSNSEKSHISNPTGLDLVEVAKAFDRATHSLGKRARLASMYWLYNTTEFQNDCKLINQFADFFVHRALRNDIEKSGEKYVFLEELVNATRDPIEIRSQLLNIFLAGRDTTAGLLGWTFWLLARHPDKFAKLREVVIQDFGTYSKPKETSFATLKNCSYLQHVMNEVLRLYPSVPINSRRAVKDTTLPRGGGEDGRSPLFVPAGTQVDYCVQAMHRRKDLWGEDALEFKPERWVGRKTGWEWLPFNGGPRICLGQQFALTEAGYTIVRLLQKYDGIKNMSSVPEDSPQYQYSVTTAPYEITLNLHEAEG